MWRGSRRLACTEQPAGSLPVYSGRTSVQGKFLPLRDLHLHVPRLLRRTRHGITHSREKNYPYNIIHDTELLCRGYTLAGLHSLECRGREQRAEGT